ncbi:uncharacterized protein LOC129410606 [Boleophthalmus pectinirostris]|uniref:uncharacterized protein LOC129410606 n=1 Tax=Boleophthalmus pectinirostris TaxID=150288 RepID=UPI00242AEE8B|nr:uncharacterized protein LOC129410606 [Boleophthalmus pectinirostris]
MAKAMCQKCGVDVPLQLLKDHVNSCSVIEIDGEQPVEDTSHLVGEKSVSCPVCLKMFPTDWIQEHASTCGESPVTPAVTSATVTSAKVTYEEDHAAIAGTSTSSATVTGANCSVTRLFEGEPSHLVPSASHFLVESDLFLMAGRMMGHSFLHGGPCLSGLSPAIVHVLLGGTPETCTVTLEDCPDLDIRDTIRLLEGESNLSEKDKVEIQDLAFAWDLPPLTEGNRKWLF